jgi:bacterial/archaeal transporter family protein
VSGQSWQVYALASAFFAGLTAILAKLGVRDVDSNLATAIRTVVILILAWGVVGAQGSYKVLPSLSGRTLLFLTLSGLATGASWLFYFQALKLGPASRVAPIDKLSVVFAIVLAALFLHEPLTWKVALGAGLMVSGAVLLVR